VTFVTQGRRRKTTPLALDTSGGYPINCYWIDGAKGEFLRMDDALSEHVLDLQDQVTYLVVRVGKGAYVGRLDDERVGTMTMMPNGDPSQTMVEVGENAAVPMHDMTGEFDEQYIGTITDASGKLMFIPVSQQPETPIRKLSEW
jgi:hypothetical protein